MDCRAANSSDSFVSDGSSTRTVRLGSAVAIDLHLDRGRFLGLGAIHAGGVALRGSSTLMKPQLRSPDGLSVTALELIDQQTRGDQLVIELRPWLADDGPMEWMLHEVRPRLRLGDAPPRPAADTTVQLALSPVDTRLGDHPAVGLRYQYHYASESLRQYRILDQGSWEIKGSAVGNTLWMRNSHAPAIHAIHSREEHYSTEWYLPTASNPNIFQFNPLQTHLQGFSFTAHDTGVLVTWATSPAHIRSIIEKPRGHDAIRHLHEHCQDLALRWSTAPMEVLWLPGERNHVDLINLYNDVREHVHAALHEKAGLRRERVTTYGIIEEWNLPDLDTYRREGLPELLEAGVETVFLPSQFANNMNTLGVANMCCTMDLRVPSSVGEEKLKALCDAALAGGASIEMWGNTALSTLATMLSSGNGHRAIQLDALDEDSTIAHLKRAAQPWVRTPSGAIEADHYTPVFAVMNLRDPAVRAHWNQRWREAYERIGLRGIFLDSSFNLTSDKFHWLANPDTKGNGGTIDQTHLLHHQRPADEPTPIILSQYMAHLSLVRDMQQMGYRYSGEDLGVFGVNRAGPGIAARLPSLPLWADSLVDFDPGAITEAGEEPDGIFFRGLAYRMMWKLYWCPRRHILTWRQSETKTSDADRPTPQQIQWLWVFRQSAGSMQHRHVLPHEAGVLYADDAASAVTFWCFEAGHLQTIAGLTSIVQLHRQGESQATSELSPQHVYRLTLDQSDDTPQRVLRRVAEAWQPLATAASAHQKQVSPGSLDACLIQRVSSSSSIASPSWMWKYRTSFTFDSTGGTGLSDVPRKKVTLMYLVMQWNARNHPLPGGPSTP